MVEPRRGPASARLTAGCGRRRRGSVRGDAVARRSLPRGEGQEPARAAPARSPVGARDRDARRRRRGVHAPSGPTFVVAPGRTTARCRPGATLVHDPGGGQGPAVRAGLEAAALASRAAPFLVVNADLPCVTRARPARARRRRPRRTASRSRRQPTARRTRSRSLGARLFVPVYGPGSAERFAALAPSRRWTHRISSMTWTPSPTSSGSATGSGRARARARLAARVRGRGAAA